MKDVQIERDDQRKINVLEEGRQRILMVQFQRTKRKTTENVGVRERERERER